LFLTDTFSTFKSDTELNTFYQSKTVQYYVRTRIDKNLLEEEDFTNSALLYKVFFSLNASSQHFLLMLEVLAEFSKFLHMYSMKKYLNFFLRLIYCILRNLNKNGRLSKVWHTLWYSIFSFFNFIFFHFSPGFFSVVSLVILPEFSLSCCFLSNL
jgi:hypothetical protein